MNALSPQGCPRLEWSVDRDETARTSNVVLAGELDVADAGELAAMLAREYRSAMVRIDMSAVTFVDARILSVLVRANQELRARTGLLVLTGVRPCVQRVLRVSGLAGVLHVETTTIHLPAARRRQSRARPQRTSHSR